MTFNAQCWIVCNLFLWGPVILSYGLVLALENHQCWIQPNVTIIVAPNKYTVSALRSAPENLRFTLSYTERIRRLSNFAFLKKELLEPAVAFWSKTLRAKDHFSEPIQLSRYVYSLLYIYIFTQKRRTYQV
ncbi:hypothetical protein P879_11703 [Paragonimus westermani]|uniref:Uncharacterized protein n=1 Tax=Paragonimus westermani TaxID=34504 RepID=A0A8T0D6F6_9TREM|nr:hypothetical protein P879_11703 [Paragonimus westermani]